MPLIDLSPSKTTCDLALFENKYIDGSVGIYTDFNNKQWSYKTENGNVYFTNNETGQQCDAPLKPQMGGTKQASKKRFEYKGQKRVVYVGARGGEYIKLNGKYVSIKQL